MKKLVKLKIRNYQDRLVPETEVSASYERGYSKKFECYNNKQWKCYRVYVRIPDRDCKELDICFQDVYRTSSEAMNAIQNFIDQWFNGLKVTLL